MGKLLKGIVRFSVAAATVGGVCYVFKDKIKQSKFYQEYDVDTKLDKVKSTIKDKISGAENEEEFVDEDEIFFDDVAPESSERDYVSLNQDSTEDEITESDDSDDTETSDDATSGDEASDDETSEVPTINI